MSEKKVQIKCVVWDLDNTIWDGVLSEGGGDTLRPQVRETIAELDRRGIIQSISSKNDRDAALERLKKFELADYFLCPQISWNPKSLGIATILQRLNLKPEAVAFVDDNPFERDEVLFAQPKIHVYDAELVPQLSSLPEFTVRFITEDAAKRRFMYQADLNRQSAEEVFSGSNDEFLATLGMKLTIDPVTEHDLQRVEELTVRTHQLNATGYTYSYEELLELSQSPQYIFRICGLTDRYGESGKVGLLLLEDTPGALKLKLLIVSCRVMTRGIGSSMLCYATQLAAQAGKKLQAEFYETEHNRIMYITYKLSGFEEIQEDGSALLLEYQGQSPLPFPDYLEIQTKDSL